MKHSAAAPATKPTGSAVPSSRDTARSDPVRFESMGSIEVKRRPNEMTTRRRRILVSS